MTSSFQIFGMWWPRLPAPHTSLVKNFYTSFKYQVNCYRLWEIFQYFLLHFMLPSVLLLTYRLSLSNSVLIIPSKLLSKIGHHINVTWIECLKNNGERFVTLYRRQWAKPPQRKRKAERQNGLSMAEKRRGVKSKGKRERYTQLNKEFQRFERRDKKPFFKKQCKQIGGNNKICSLLQIPSRKLEMLRKHFLQRWAQ